MLLTLKRRALALGLCSEYTNQWNAATSKEDLMRIATDPNGADFLCDGVAFHWGLTVQYILEHFAPFINGNYVVQHEGYTSELYVAHNAAIRPRTAIIILLGCNCTIRMEKSRPVQIFAANSTINFEGHCDAVLHAYNSTFDTHRAFNAYIDTTITNKSQWVKPSDKQ